jgi:RNA polymerase sigma-70 factor (ECF subfamily)
MTSDIAPFIPLLRGVSMILTGNRERADDLVEETIMRIWNGPRPVSPGTERKVWMLTILHNVHYSRLSEGRVTIRSIGVTSTDAPNLLSSQGAAFVSDKFLCAFWQLGEEEREALILEEAIGLSCEEVAKVFGCTTGMIATRVSHARQKLRTLSAVANNSQIRRRPLKLDHNSRRRVEHRSQGFQAVL